MTGKREGGRKEEELMKPRRRKGGNGREREKGKGREGRVMWETVLGSVRKEGTSMGGREMERKGERLMKAGRRKGGYGREREKMEGKNEDREEKWRYCGKMEEKKKDEERKAGNGEIRRDWKGGRERKKEKERDGEASRERSAKER